MENQRHVVALDFLGLDKKSVSEAAATQKPPFCFFESSRSSPSVAMSLRTRQTSAMSLKHIFDRISASSDGGLALQEQKATQDVSACSDQKKAEASATPGFDTVKKRVSDLDLSLCNAPLQDPAALLRQRQPFGSPFPVTQGFYPGTTCTQRANGWERQSKAQLTIFYAGMVNVYDDVPADKAHAIMLLAGSANPMSTHSIPTVLPASESLKRPATSIKPAAASPVSVSPLASQTPPLTSAEVKEGSSTALEFLKYLQPQLPASAAAKRSQSELPHARKASLARFLEKRKDRVQVKAPVKEDEKEMMMGGCERPSSPKRQCITMQSPSFGCNSSNKVA